MTARALSVDPLWPRAGGWPAVGDVEEPLDLALVGIPTWRTSLSATGAGETPAAVRAALRYYSAFLAPDRSAPAEPSGATPARVGSLDALRIADFGDASEPDGAEGEARAAALVADAAARASVVVALGGDNALTVPVALGTWGADIARAGLITLDAHYDLRDGISNGSPVRRLVEAGLDGRRIVQIGIADFANSRAYAERAAELGITVVHRDELYRRPIADVMAEALQIAGSAGGPIHLDIDVDVCDRSVAPACPAAVPGGISAYELRSAVRAAARHPQLRSVDIAEVDATADAPDGRTVRLAALCVLEVVAGLAHRTPSRAS
ncbi:arginase family protein [Leifsonia sp. Root112D2]|uniref:arginase family protein n=1 Tax=Leifsonia sp. Root112D2 TaxID=1736426 RepID=UPI0006F913AE|nr:arginase family protein [Leifsonia sp. Root112D2]KQV06945.1 formimidoylglutamase [Leifsonia sp. Root112D2]